SRDWSSDVCSSDLMKMPLSGKIVSASDRIHVGVIGTGKRGLGLIQMAEKIPGLKVVACCDIIPEKLSAALAKVGTDAKAYTEYEELLANKDVDAVIIATPLYLHYPMAVAALSANKHEYVEKSMAFTIAQSLDVVKRLRRSQLAFQGGFQHRSFEEYHKIKEVLQAGWIGYMYC